MQTVKYCLQYKLFPHENRLIYTFTINYQFDFKNKQIERLRSGRISSQRSGARVLAVRLDVTRQIFLVPTDVATNQDSVVTL